MASIVARKRMDGTTGCKVQWRLGGARGGPWQSETFDDRRAAASSRRSSARRRPFRTSPATTTRTGSSGGARADQPQDDRQRAWPAVRDLQERRQAGLITRNPCEDVKLPAVDDDIETDDDMTFLSEAEFELLRRCIDPVDRDFLVVAVGTGLRWGELTARGCRCR